MCTGVRCHVCVCDFPFLYALWCSWYMIIPVARTTSELARTTTTHLNSFNSDTRYSVQSGGLGEFSEYTSSDYQEEW